MKDKDIEKKPLVALDIDKMLQNINESKEASEPSSLDEEPQIDKEENIVPATDNTEQEQEHIIDEEKQPEEDLVQSSSLWDDFLANCNEYSYRVRVNDRKPYQIDEDIVNTLKSCDINKTAVVNVINAMLRSFIKCNKDNLRQYVEKKDILI